MTIKIGEQQHATRRPSDLDEQLLATTGHNSTEMARLLGEHPLPGTIARALMPFLGKDAPVVSDLAHSIAEAGPLTVLADVRKLYEAGVGDEGATKGAE